MNKSSCWHDNDQRCSFACVPEAIILVIVFRFLNEEDAFRVRGTCFLFSRAYFWQSYWKPNSKRVLFMLSNHYKYQNLKKITLKDYKEPIDLSPFKSLPGLEELRIEYVNFYLDTLPAKFIQLRKLEILERATSTTTLRDLSALSNCYGLEELSLIGTKNIKPQMIPSSLKCLRMLKMVNCGLSDLSTLSRFPAINELILSSNASLDLTTLPINLTQLLKLNVGSCNLSNLSHLNRFPGLENLVMYLNRSIKLDTIFLIRVRKLTLFACDLSDVSALSWFPALEECNLSRNDIVIDSIPENLIHLRELNLRYCNLGDVSSLCRLPALEKVTLRHNESLDVNTIPKGLRSDLYFLRNECR